MKFKQKTGQLASILVLSAVLYMPQASASPLMVPSPQTGDSFTIFNISAGLFTENYTFNVNSDALFSFSGSSIDTIGYGGLGFLTNGASLNSVSILDTTSNANTNIQLTSNTTTQVNSLNPSDYITQTTYRANLGNFLLNASDSYQLIFNGNSEGNNSNISGTIFLSTASAVTTVPLPGATWLFLTGLMGFLGLNRSRNANRAA